MVRFYLVPVEVVPFHTGTLRTPKYLSGSLESIIAGGWEARDYGTSPTMLVAVDISTADAATLAAQSDVVTFSANLDTALGSRLAAMQTAIEALNLPAQMLTGSTTDRQVIRGIMGIILVAQCMQGKGRNIFAAGVTLSTQMNQIPTAARADLDACMRAVGFTAIADAATGTTTVRQILTSIAQVASPSIMIGVTV